MERNDLPGVHEYIESAPNLVAALILDPTLMKPDWAALVDELIRYTHQGALVICGAPFGFGPENTQEVNDYFGRWGVPWEQDYLAKREWELNMDFTTIPSREIRLPYLFIGPAMQLKRVPRCHQLYTADNGSSGRTPVAVSAVGSGYFAWVGGRWGKGEEGFASIVKGLCGACYRNPPGGQILITEQPAVEENVKLEGQGRVEEIPGSEEVVDSEDAESDDSWHTPPQYPHEILESTRDRDRDAFFDQVNSPGGH